MRTQDPCAAANRAASADQDTAPASLLVMHAATLGVSAVVEADAGTVTAVDAPEIPVVEVEAEGVGVGRFVSPPHAQSAARHGITPRRALLTDPP